MSLCPKCEKPTGTGGLCLPCRAGVKSISRAAEVTPVRCKRCGEPLHDRKSRQRGFGPTCWVIEQVEGSPR